MYTFNIQLSYCKCISSYGITYIYACFISHIHKLHICLYILFAFNIRHNNTPNRKCIITHLNKLHNCTYMVIIRMAYKNAVYIFTAHRTQCRIHPVLSCTFNIRTSTIKQKIMSARSTYIYAVALPYI